ncbi:hypothetical protein ILUMI_07841 [Ignelater luminosus]|uniref:Uncharacterized protein n=1 Tax=Ignelater luminosus TaxID=2038154 RepID=A0A8K0D7A3_IGNLU|nr:hypothetical protein ILUMI_07841 [Ignelater luminosus]
MKRQEGRLRKRKDHPENRPKVAKKLKLASTSNTGADYGSNIADVEIDEDNLKKEDEELIKRMKVSTNEIKEIAKNTVRNLITRLIRRQDSTSCDSLVKRLLIRQHFSTPAIEYGKRYEETAICKFMSLYGKIVQPGGTFIHSKHGYLAASPDGIINGDEIVEVNCMFKVASSGRSLNDVVKNGEVPCLQLNSNEIELKKTHFINHSIFPITEEHLNSGCSLCASGDSPTDDYSCIIICRELVHPTRPCSYQIDKDDKNDDKKRICYNCNSNGYRADSFINNDVFEDWRGLVSRKNRKKNKTSICLKKATSTNTFSLQNTKEVLILRNGNSAELSFITHEKCKYSLANTCAFDSIFQILYVGYLDYANIRDYLDSMHKPNDILKLVQKVSLENKITTGTTKFCNAKQLLANLFKTSPNFKEVYNCNDCGFQNTYDINHAKTGRHNIEKSLAAEIIAYLETASDTYCSNPGCKSILNKNLVPEEVSQKDMDTMEINTAAVEGIVSIGGGFYNLEEFLTSMDIPSMDPKTYAKYYDIASAGWKKAAKKEMEEAAKLKKDISLRKESVDENGSKLGTAMDDWMLSNPGRAITIQDLPGLSHMAYAYSFTIKIIVEGFKKTETRPLNRSKFSDEDFDCAFVTDTPQLCEASEILSETSHENIPATLAFITSVTPEVVRPFPKA